MSKRSELYKDAFEQERRLLVHFHALSQFLDKDNPISREDFEKQYPRTYNAVLTDKLYSFDLPKEEENV